MTLQASQLAYARGQRSLFADIGFEIGPGEALRIAGRNGSGKTSLLRVLAGLSQPLTGEIRWHGRSIRAQRETFQRALTYIGHIPALKDDLLAWENVCASALLAGQACTPQQAVSALSMWGLDEGAFLPARVLSQGQKRRVALARLSLASSRPAAAPQLWILDEPFVALDQDALQTLTALLSDQLSRGTVLVYTTHQVHAFQAVRHHELVLGRTQASASEWAEASHEAEAL